jgi:hypothetical protein
MKKVFIYILVTIALVACGGGDDGGGSEPVIVTNEFLSVSPTSILLPGVENGQEMTISANCKWSVSSDVSWISVSPSSGEGNGTVTLSVSLNNSGAERTGTVIVKNDKLTLEKKVRVTQGTPTGAIIPTISDNEYPD